MNKHPKFLKTFFFLATILSTLLCFSGCFTLPPVQRNSETTLEAVKDFDLNRYLGLWYNIANYDVSFQRGCRNTTAQYELKKNGRISVLNKCRKGSENESFDMAEGEARIANPALPAQLEVSFSIFQPWSDYWVILVDADYQWAAVGEPSGRFLWVLARTPAIEIDLYENILKQLRDLGYPTHTLEKTIHTQN